MVYTKENFSKKAKYALIIIALGFIACPPPSNNLSFKLDDKMYTRLAIQEDNIGITISGIHMHHGVADWMYLNFEFSGIQKLDKKTCLKYIHFESNRFKNVEGLRFVSGEPSLAIIGDTCYMEFAFRHDTTHVLEFQEYINDLDTVYARIMISGIHNKIDTIEVVFDKKWLANRFGVNYENYKEKKNK